MHARKGLTAVQFSVDMQLAELGPQRGSFGPNKAGTIFGIIFATIIGGGLGIVFTVIAAKPAADGSSANFVGGSVIALICFGLAALADVFAVRVLHRTVVVHANGMVVTQDKHQAIYRWDQAASVTQYIVRRYTNGIYSGTTHRYTLRMMDGRRVVFSDGIRNVEQLGKQIQAGVSTELLPRALAAVRGGQTISFGKFGINQGGITLNTAILPWNEVASIDVKRGAIVIRKRDQRRAWGTTSVGVTPNVFIFLAVAEQLRRAAISTPPVGV
jgi:hypothetical protein